MANIKINRKTKIGRQKDILNQAEKFRGKVPTISDTYLSVKISLSRFNQYGYSPDVCLQVIRAARKTPKVNLENT